MRSPRDATSTLRVHGLARSALPRPSGFNTPVGELTAALCRASLSPASRCPSKRLRWPNGASQFDVIVFTRGFGNKSTCVIETAMIQNLDAPFGHRRRWLGNRFAGNKDARNNVTRNSPTDVLQLDGRGTALQACQCSRKVGRNSKPKKQKTFFGRCEACRRNITARPFLTFFRNSAIHRV